MWHFRCRQIFSKQSLSSLEKGGAAFFWRFAPCSYLHFSNFFHEWTRIGCRNWSWHGFDINHFHLVFWIRQDSNPQSLDHESSLLTTRLPSRLRSFSLNKWVAFLFCLPYIYWSIICIPCTVCFRDLAKLNLPMVVRF